MSSQIDFRFLQDWVSTAVDALGSAREDIDALNVFPVPDGDTGTNMFLTLEAGQQSMLAAASEDIDSPEELLAVSSAALLRGVLMGARGNSGVILSQIVRGVILVDPLEPETVARSGVTIRRGLAQAAELAYAAVAEPKEGTMLTVIRCAAEAAAGSDSEDLADVLGAAVAGAEDALARTTEMLEPLRRAGVVDSGGYGIVVILSALLEVVSGVRRPPPPAERPSVDVAEEPEGYGGPGYEVMFLLEAVDDQVPDLKRSLAELGDSLVVVGGDGLWNIHVHVDDAGAAVEAGMAAGKPYRIRITYLLEDPAGHSAPRGRSIVAVAHGEGIASLLREMEVVPVLAEPGQAPATGELLQAALASDSGEIMILPSDKNVTSSAESAAQAARSQGLRVAVVPTRSIVQSLAALAVHDSDVDFDDDVVGMSRAAGATRYGAVTTSTKDAITTAGTCSPGDILGIVDGDILKIGDDIGTVARETFDLMLSTGGELLTVVTGQAADGDLIDQVTDYIEVEHPAVDVIVYQGNQPIWPLIFGVE